MGDFDKNYLERLIIEKIIAGDEKALEYFFNKKYFSLVNYLYNILNDKHQAEDIAQEAFIIFWENRSNLKIEKYPTAFLFKIARNLSLNYLKKENRKESREDIDDEFYPELAFETPSNFIINQEISLALQRAIEKLPEKRREIFALSKIAGLSHEEISQTLNISIQTIKNQLNRAYAFLKEELKDMRE